MALNSRVLIIAAVMALVCTLYVLSTALPYWRTHESLGVKTEAGLWSICTTILGSRSCSRITGCSGSECNKYYAARVFMTIAVVLSASSVVALLISLLQRDTNSKPAVATAGRVLPFISLVCGIVGVTVGATVGASILNFYGAKLGVSVVLGIVALIINLVVCIVAIVPWRST